MRLICATRAASILVGIAGCAPAPRDATGEDVGHGTGRPPLEERLEDSRPAEHVARPPGDGSHHDAAQVALQPDPGPSSQSTENDGVEVDRTRTFTVQFDSGDAAIIFDVGLRGPTGEVHLPYMFDTGSSFFTISSSTARTLGIVIPPDAPTLEFKVAGGSRASPMVYVPGVIIGDIRIEGVLASVCDNCGAPRSVGFIGLNLLRDVLVELDYGENRLRLIPKKLGEQPNRAQDAEVMTHLEVETPAEVWDGRFAWIVRVENRGSVALADVVPYVQFEGGERIEAQAISLIAPASSGASLVEGSVAMNKDEPKTYMLGLAHAHWRPDTASPPASALTPGGR